MVANTSVSYPIPATILINTSTVIVRLDDLRLFSIVVPATWTAANLTFQASYDGGTTFFDVFKDGAEYVYTATAGKDNDVDLQRFSSIPILKIRSGTAATPVNQAQASTLILVTRSV